MEIQWYPGHMTKTRRMMEENVRLVDCVIELVDARVPSASRNDTVYDLFKGKTRVLMLNKADLADPERTARWKERFAPEYDAVLAGNASQAKDVARVCAAVRNVMAERIAAKAEKGMTMTVRAMVVGIPNAGKSTFTNTAAGAARAKTGDMPGVTRAKQWIRADRYLELLDTPGILPPKIRSRTDGLLLAFTGAVRDDILDLQELLTLFADTIRTTAPGALAARYKLEDENGPADELIGRICRKRGWIRSGGVEDRERAARVIFDEYRAGKLGRITLEELP